MSQRLNYAHQAPELVKKLTELSQASKHSSIEESLLDFVHIRASQLNGCAFCFDMHVKEAKIHGERDLRVHHVSIWRESTLFSDRERAAIEWTEAVTQLGPDGVPNDVYERARTQFSEKEIVDLTFAVAIINTWNRLGVAFRPTPGSMDAFLGLTKSGLS